MPFTTGSGRDGFASAVVGNFSASSSTGLLTNSYEALTTSSFSESWRKRSIW
jgi:hypothetical protein